MTCSAPSHTPRRKSCNRSRRRCAAWPPGAIPPARCAVRTSSRSGSPRCHIPTGAAPAPRAVTPPDNGLLAPVVSRAPDALIVRLGAGELARLGVHRPSATFHGRDIFAPVAAELAAGRCQPEDLGERVSALVPSWVEDPTVEPRSVTGVVISIDHFGNLITNIDAALIERFRLPLVHAGNHSFPLLRTYGDSRPGEYLALVNSFGVVEIARAENSAAEGLGLSRGAPVVVRDRTDQP